MKVLKTLKAVAQRALRLAIFIAMFPIRLIAFLGFILKLKSLVQKGVALTVVGGSPNIIGSGMGAVIDRSPIVLRINFQDHFFDTYDVGIKTDIRWLGANLSDKHFTSIKRISDEVVISTIKNKIELQKHGIKAIYYDNLFYERVFRLFLWLHGNESGFRDFRKPLRTGSNILFCLWLSRVKDLRIMAVSRWDDTEGQIYAIARNILHDLSSTKPLLEKNHMPIRAEKLIEKQLINRCWPSAFKPKITARHEAEPGC